MSTAAVHELVDRVQRLREDERQLFDELLVQLEEQEWRRESKKARRLARDRGIDQEAIDRAVADLRYCSGRSFSTPMSTSRRRFSAGPLNRCSARP